MKCPISMIPLILRFYLTDAVQPGSLRSLLSLECSVLPLLAYRYGKGTMQQSHPGFSGNEALPLVLGSSSA